MLPLPPQLLPPPPPPPPPPLQPQVARATLQAMGARTVASAPSHLGGGGGSDGDAASPSALPLSLAAVILRTRELAKHAAHYARTTPLSLSPPPPPPPAPSPPPDDGDAGVGNGSDDEAGAGAFAWHGSGVDGGDGEAPLLHTASQLVAHDADEASDAAGAWAPSPRPPQPRPQAQAPVARGGARLPEHGLRAATRARSRVDGGRDGGFA
jgi:hypothetical protein